jgi:hypothetical protein
MKIFLNFKLIPNRSEIMQTKKLLIYILVFLTGNLSLATGSFSLMESNLQNTPDSLPLVLPEDRSDLIFNRLRNEAVLKYTVHQIPASPEEWMSYKSELKDMIIEKAGITLPDHNLPLDVRVTKTIRMDGYRIENIYFQTMPGIYATANLFIPDGRGPFPGVLVMCGHSSNGKVYDPYQAVGHALALNDYVGMVIDPWGAGERTTVHGEFEYHGASLGASLMNIGESLLGIQIVDNMRGIDLLSSLPYVDSEKIGATGASGGGNQTMWLAAMDERVKAAVPVVSVGTFESYVMRSNCICETLIDGLSFTEEAAVLALSNAIMPINHGRESNPAFFIDEMLRSYNNARGIFAMKGRVDNIDYRTFDLTHGYHPETRQAMLGWFDLKLKGTGTGEIKREDPFEIIPPEELMVFPNGKRDPLVVSTEKYCKRRGEELRNGFLSRQSFNAGEERRKLVNILQVNERPELRNIHRYSTIDNWDRFALETSDGKLIPVLHMAPLEKSQGYIVISNPDGKNNIPGSLIEQFRQEGAGLVVVDLSGTGEAASASESRLSIGRRFHTTARAEIWLGKRLLGEWVKELETVAEFLSSEFNAQRISLYGFRETGLAGLFLGATSEMRIDEISLNDAPVSYLFDNREDIDFYSMAIHLPGFLRWGDISLVRALGRSDVRFINPRSMSGESLDRNQVEEYKAEFNRVKKLCNNQKGETFFQ